MLFHEGLQFVSLLFRFRQEGGQLLQVGVHRLAVLGVHLSRRMHPDALLTAAIVIADHSAFLHRNISCFIKARRQVADLADEHLDDVPSGFIFNPLSDWHQLLAVGIHPLRSKGFFRCLAHGHPPFSFHPACKIGFIARKSGARVVCVPPKKLPPGGESAPMSLIPDSHHVPAAVVAVGPAAGSLPKAMVHPVVAIVAQQHQVAWVEADVGIVDVVRRQLYDVVHLMCSRSSAFIADKMFLFSNQPGQILPRF